jgi:DNA primase
MTTKQERVWRWLSDAGGQRIRNSGVGNLVSTCPFHVDSKPSFSISFDSGLFICYSAQCGVSGNLINFLVSGLNWTYPKARIAAEDFEIGERVPLEEIALPDFIDRKRKADGIVYEKVREGLLGLYDFKPAYMVERGFSTPVLRRWEVGFDYGSRRVTLPVRDRKGALVGISKRAIDFYQEPPYLHLGFSKGLFLYGAHLVPEGAGIVVMEGQLDVQTWDQTVRIGSTSNLYPVSTMGSRVSKIQIGLMRKYPRVFLAFDDDEDGRAATRKVGEALLPTFGPDLSVLRQFPVVDGVRLNDPGDLFKASHLEALHFATAAESYDKVRLESSH